MRVGGFSAPGLVQRRRRENQGPRRRLLYFFPMETLGSLCVDLSDYQQRRELLVEYRRVFARRNPWWTQTGTGRAKEERRRKAGVP